MKKPVADVSSVAGFEGDLDVELGAARVVKSGKQPRDENHARRCWRSQGFGIWRGRER